MTAPDFAAMSDTELNECAARLMGWDLRSVDFDPSCDLNDAGLFSGAFRTSERAKGREWVLRIESGVVDGKDINAVLFWLSYPQEEDDPGVIGKTYHVNRARAETEATCAAWYAMKAANG